MKRVSQMMMTKTTSNNYSNKIVLMTTMCKGLAMKMMMMVMTMMGRKILKNMHSLIAKSHIPSDLPFFLTYTNCFRMSNLRST